MQDFKSIYQMYIENGCDFGFFVRRDSWGPDRCAKVTAIEIVEDGKTINGERLHFEGFRNHPCQTHQDNIMDSLLVRLEADWLIGGIVETDSGGYACWERVYP